MYEGSTLTPRDPPLRTSWERPVWGCWRSQAWSGYEPWQPPWEPEQCQQRTLRWLKQPGTTMSSRGKCSPVGWKHRKWSVSWGNTQGNSVMLASVRSSGQCGQKKCVWLSMRLEVPLQLWVRQCVYSLSCLSLTTCQMQSMSEWADIYVNTLLYK